MCKTVVRSQHRIFGGKTTLVAGTLHQHTLSVDISRREDMWHIALQVVVDRDRPAVGHLYSSGSKVERIHISWPASRKEDRVYRQTAETLLMAVVQSDTTLSFFQALGFSTSHD